MFIEFVINIATFDLIPPEVILWIFSFPEDTEAFSEGFDSTGYGSMYPVENLGTCWMLVQIYCLLTLIWLILRQISKSCKSPRLIRVRDKISRFLFWGAALRFLFQGYLELCLSIFIGWYKIEWSG